MALFGRRRAVPGPQSTTAVVLAGGQSSRFGRDKGLAVLGGRPLVAWVVTGAGAAARQTVLVLAPGTDADAWRQAVGHSGAEFGLSVVHDETPFGGPVAGLRAATKVVDSKFVLVAGVDMPLVRPDLLLGLLERLSGHDAVAFHIDGWWRPLPSVWRTESLRTALELAQKRNVGSLHGLCDLLDTRPLGREFLSLFSADGSALDSINTVADLDKAERVIARTHEENQ